MAYFRLVFLLTFFLGGFPQVQAQRNPVLYAGVDYYRNGGFEEDSYVNLNAGIQLYQLGFFVPEVGYDLFYGSLEDRKNFEDPIEFDKEPGLLERNFSTSLLTLSPKLKFGRDDAFFTLVPKFHTGNVIARGNYYLPNENYNRYQLQERQSESSRVSFWSFSIGFEAYLFQTDRYWFAFFLNYTKLDADIALSKLDFLHYGVEYSGKISSTVGAGIRFYFDPFYSEND